MTQQLHYLPQILHVLLRLPVASIEDRVRSGLSLPIKKESEKDDGDNVKINTLQ